MVKGFFKSLLRLNQTVFSTDELPLIWRKSNTNRIKARLNYYARRGDLYHIRRGFYAKDRAYDHYEFATKLYAPSYISFETVLISAGVVFQYYSQIFVASSRSRTLSCDGQTYVYRRLKPSILEDLTGIERRDNYNVASAERAFLDVLYLQKGYHFDNISGLNWEKIYEILKIYEGNKRMQKIVDKYYVKYKEGQ